MKVRSKVLVLVWLFFCPSCRGGEAPETVSVEEKQSALWYLAMNLNPADGHIMDYTTGWAEDRFIGTYSRALTHDFLSRVVWNEPVSYIALVRHWKGVVEAVKVFRFRESSRSLLSRFKDMNPGREVVTEGGPLEEHISISAQNMADDPVFSVEGDLAFNWGYGNNGVRIVLTGGHLSRLIDNDDNTHGLGNHFACNPLTGNTTHKEWAHEISNIQDSGRNPTVVQGTDHGSGSKYISGPVYGNYAIFVSKTANTFLKPGNMLDIEIEIKPRYKFF